MEASTLANQLHIVRDLLVGAQRRVDQSPRRLANAIGVIFAVARDTVLKVSQTRTTGPSKEYRPHLIGGAARCAIEIRDRAGGSDA